MELVEWDVAIQTNYIPWGSLALPKPQAFLGTNNNGFFFAKGRRLTL
ncbi:MAG: hypothetical protein K2M07_07580 [Muribaculaceae bacterium]|nr:hypothetical protein [Muribaculaceae bacterium]